MATVPQPSGTVSLVFTDVEGSTRLLEELGAEAYRDALGEHRRIVREACARFSGYEVDYEGDAFFYAFQSAADAVGAVAAFMAGLEGGPIRLRVGVHTGEPIVDPPKYVGMDVHRAARIMSAAHGGQVVLSRETVALLPTGDDQLPRGSDQAPSNDPVQDMQAQGTQLRGLVLVDLGEHRFKDLAAPERVFQLGEGAFPRLKSLFRVVLPVPATPFLGREAELAEVVSRLAEPATRLLTLTGPGGTGKTRLALQAAAEASDGFPDGVWWVALAPLRDAALVVPSLQRVLELPEQPDVGPVEVVAQALLGKKALVLLDNAEHLLPALAGDLAALAAACPTLTLLVTSRERLQIAVETSWPVPSLAPDEAVALFLVRAADAGVGLEDDEVVRELCRRLDALPLALELAAARTVLLSPAQLLERLGRRLDLLKGPRDADPRQQTLRATIEWSYGLLDGEERRVYRALGVFAGGCTLEAAEQVASADLDVVQSLLDKSLLRRNDEAGRGRLWMLETVREHAIETLEELGEADPVRGRHAEWFGRLAARVAGRSAWSATIDRADALEADLDNLRAAFAHRVAAGDAAWALEMAVGLYPVWEMRDRLREGDEWLETALSLPSDGRTELHGMAYGARCAIGWHLGRDQASLLALAETGLSIIREAGSERELAQALMALAWVQWMTDPDAALVTAEEALETARRFSPPGDIRAGLHLVGEIRRDAGDYDAAAALLHEALQLARDLHETGFVSGVIHSLADIELDRGDDTAAWDRYLEAADAATVESSVGNLAGCVGGLATVAARRGQPRLAWALWGALERWEYERGATLSHLLRARYEHHFDTAANLAGEPAPTLEQAIALARDAAFRAGPEHGSRPDRHATPQPPSPA